MAILVPKRNLRITNTEDCIADLKRSFVHPLASQQKKVSFSPSQASGSISLAFYRGKDAGWEEGIKSCIALLKKKYPAAAKYLKESTKA